MHRRLAIAFVSCVSLALFTGSCSLLIDADRFSDEQSDGGTGNIDGNTDGRGPDSSVDTGSACDGRVPLLFDRDRFLLSNGSLSLDQAGTYVLDTANAGRLLDPAGQEVPGTTMLIQTSPGDNSEFLLVVVNDLYISPATTLRAIGPRPLHLAAAGIMDLHGTIDVSSNAEGVGAGADTGVECETAGQGASGTGDGGGGGGFQGAGGNGGPRALFASAIGGAETNQNLSTVLRGGCRGGDSSGAGGSGGGALMLLACESIMFDARIMAYGQGGGGADGGIVGGGGGGGGSGGFVGVDTPVLTVVNGAFEERIDLGGGGGGGGGGSVLGQAGDNGADGLTGAPGAGGGSGGDGGAGGQAQAIDVKGGDGGDGTLGGGGGGGGGGAGYLLDLSGDRP